MKCRQEVPKILSNYSCDLKNILSIFRYSVVTALPVCINNFNLRLQGKSQMTGLKRISSSLCISRNIGMVLIGKWKIGKICMQCLMNTP